MARHSIVPLLCPWVSAAALLAVAAPTPAQTFEKLVDFQCSTIGCAPNGQLILARDGYLYGTTSEGGTETDRGTVFRMDYGGSIQVLTEPARWFFQASDGLFYGTSGDGGAFGGGAVYRMDTTGQITELYSFNPVSAIAPGPMVQARDGSFYGIVSVPETDLVRLFRMDSDNHVTLLRPAAAAIANVRMMLAGRNGLLYGTTYGGVVYRMNRNGQSRVLHAFPTVYLDIMQATDGSFYGTTIDGGAAGAGILFRMLASGKVTVAHTFDGGAGGANPYEAPIEGRDGNLYGTTGMGGAYGLGTIYRVDGDGTFTILHSFGPAADAGAYPVGEIVFGNDGALYGTTVFGGANDHGTAWRLRLK